MNVPDSSTSTFSKQRQRPSLPLNRRLDDKDGTPGYAKVLSPLWAIGLSADVLSDRCIYDCRNCSQHVFSQHGRRNSTVDIVSAIARCVGVAHAGAGHPNSQSYVPAEGLPMSVRKPAI
eukprot:3872985-Pyramimonas_sp.AAC.1